MKDKTEEEQTRKREGIYGTWEKFEQDDQENEKLREERWDREKCGIKFVFILDLR